MSNDAISIGYNCATRYQSGTDNIAIGYQPAGTNVVDLYKLMKICEQNQKENADLKQQIQELKTTLNSLITHIHYMPGGIGYDEAKQHFEGLQNNNSSR